MKKSMLMIAAAVLALSLTMSACGGSGNAPAPTATGAGAPTDNATAGNDEAQALAKANCISCHGTDLKGAGAPNLQAIGAKYSEAELANIIANGQGGMPAFNTRLSEAEITTLAAWLAAMK